MYWSMRTANKRCRYVCSIGDVEGRPEFRITVEERGELDLELKDTSARGVWMKVLEPLAELRRTSSIVQLFNKYITGEDLFGLTEPAIVRVLESLPGMYAIALTELDKTIKFIWVKSLSCLCLALIIVHRTIINCKCSADYFEIKISICYYN